MQATSTVLIIDDEPIARAGLEALLAGEGYRLEFATNGEEGLTMAAELVPDVILLDIMMPDMDGYEVCRRLKADPVTAELPVIFLTVRSDGEDEQKGVGVGCVDYISKPVSPPILLARVKTHIMLKSARDFLKDQAAYLEEEVERRVRARTG